MNTALVPMESRAIESERSIEEVIGQIAKIQQLMKSVLKDGEHYGKIPGCGDKPSLLKPGAEKLGFMFRLVPKFEVEQERELAKGHIHMRVRCDLVSSVTGNFHGSGIGSCSTMESKYRYRVGPKEGTGKPVPKEYWNLRNSEPEKALALIGGKGFSVAKLDGQWEIVEKGEKVENDNPADQYNTILKMAEKRAHVAAMLFATAASDIFTQDLEDLSENGVIDTPKPKPEPAPVPKPAPQPEPEDDNPPFDSLKSEPPASKPELVSQGKDEFSDEERKAKGLISKAQGSRMWAIAKSRKLSKEALSEIIGAMGYKSTNDVTKKDYESLCNALGSWTKEEHDRIVIVLKGMADGN